MAKKRRKIHSLGDLVWDKMDDVKDLVRNEIDAQTGRGDRKSSGSSSREQERARRSREQAEEMDDLREMIMSLNAKLTEMTAAQEQADEPDRATEQGLAAEQSSEASAEAGRPAGSAQD